MTHTFQVSWLLGIIIIIIYMCYWSQYLAAYHYDRSSYASFFPAIFLIHIIKRINNLLIDSLFFNRLLIFLLASRFISWLPPLILLNLSCCWSLKVQISLLRLVRAYVSIRQLLIECCGRTIATSLEFSQYTAQEKYHVIFFYELL